jgi:hypothetical protein
LHINREIKNLFYWERTSLTNNGIGVTFHLLNMAHQQTFLCVVLLTRTYPRPEDERWITVVLNSVQ